MRKLDARQVAREKSAFRYSSALERGDFSTVEIILQEAERDTVLAQMLAEINMVYESELIRLSPPTSGLNHSTNHHRKDLLMTTITLPAPQRSAQRWLPFTLAAACLSVLFIAALLMRPTPDGSWLAGLQGRASETPTAIPTIVPTLTATPFVATIGEGTALPPTVVPPDMPGVMQPPIVAEQGICRIANLTREPISLFAAPLTQNSSAAVVGELAPNESAVILYQNTDPASAPFAATWFLMMTDGESGEQATGWASANSLEPLQMACGQSPALAFGDMLGTATPVPMAGVPEQAIEPTATPFPMTGVVEQATATPVPMVGVVEPMPVPSVPTALPPSGMVNTLWATAETCKIVAGENAQIFTRPDGVVIEHIVPNNIVVVVDSSDNWDYVFAPAQGIVLQGWVNSSNLQSIECPSVPEPAALPVMGDVLPPTLIPPALAVAGTPTAYFDDVMRNPQPVIVVLEDFAGIPANTEVKIASALYDGMQWIYEVQSADGIIVSIRQDDLIRITAIGATTAAVAEGMCQVVNTSRESAPVYSEPSNQSILVNNLAPDVPAKVLYQQFNRTTGENWFLVLAVLPEGKQVSGWVSIDSVSLVGMGCPAAQP